MLAFDRAELRDHRVELLAALRVLLLRVQTLNRAEFRFEAATIVQLEEKGGAQTASAQ
jgi:hypothetical protein